MDFLVAHFAAILFWVVAAATVAAAVGVVALRNPVHAALSLLATFLMVAILFVLRGAEFLGAVQVLVYAGGILVLFLFVIMLVNVRKLRPEGVFLPGAAPAAVALAVLLGAAIAFSALLRAAPPAGPEGGLVSVEGAALGNTQALAWTLYRTYLIPFEVVSVVLLVAMIGAVIFGRREPALGSPEKEEGEG